MKTTIPERLIDKYELSFPLAKPDRKRILKAKKRTFRIIIKSEVVNSISVPAALFFENLLRKLGFESTPALGARVFAAAVFAAVFLAIAAPVAVFNYRYFQTGIKEKGMTAEYAKGSILYSKGDVRIIRKGEAVSAAVKGSVETDDSIVTGKTSSVVLKMENDIVRVMAESECGVSMKENSKSFSLHRGRIFCSVHHADNKRFIVTTPNTEVMVTGTVFSVEYMDERTKATVQEGTVNIKRKSDNKTVRLEKGNSAVVDDDIEIIDAEKNDTEILKGFSELDYTESGLSVLDERIEELDRPKKEPEQQARIKTLDDIKKRYGRLEEVELYNGKRIKGVIISRGDEFSIMTVSGIRKVNSKSVKAVRIIK